MPPPINAISLGKRLRASSRIPTFGVRPNWEDYAPEVQSAIRAAECVYYPTPLYAEVLRSIGKQIRPRNYYGFMGNKILQTALFQLLEISHPHTRLYYGRDRLGRILSEFTFPFVAKNPIGSSKGVGVYLIRDENDLTDYLLKFRPAYIQEYLPIDRDLRVVLLNGTVVHAYWRIMKRGEYRSNVARGADISLDDIPPEGLAFASDVATRCGFDEVGMDVCCVRGRFYVLEANMVFGLEGFRQAGLDIYDLLSEAAQERSLPPG